VNYRGSALSCGAAGKVQGGDRLPWVADAAGTQDNFAPLATLKWQVHIYGDPNAKIAEFCAGALCSTNNFPWQAACHDAGIMRDAMYLVRPDGYVALADPEASVQKLAQYFAVASAALRAEIASRACQARAAASAAAANTLRGAGSAAAQGCRPPLRLPRAAPRIAAASSAQRSAEHADGDVGEKHAQEHGAHHRGAHARRCRARHERKQSRPIIKKRDSEQHIVDDRHETGTRPSTAQPATSSRFATQASHAPVAILMISPGSPPRAAWRRHRAKRKGTAMMLTSGSMELNHATGT
jgi:hypothetical protein